MTRTKLTAQEKADWLNALRSGDYTQTTGTLRHKRVNSSDHRPTGFCCLGVLVDVLGAEWTNVPDEAGDYLYEIEDFWPYDLEESMDLWTMNDTEGASFNEIADWIEANVTTEG